MAAAVLEPKAGGSGTRAEAKPPITSSKKDLHGWHRLERLTPDQRAELTKRYQDRQRQRLMQRAQGESDPQRGLGVIAGMSPDIAANIPTIVQSQNKTVFTPTGEWSSIKADMTQGRVVGGQFLRPGPQLQGETVNDAYIRGLVDAAKKASENASDPNREANVKEIIALARKGGVPEDRFSEILPKTANTSSSATELSKTPTAEPKQPDFPVNAAAQAERKKLTDGIEIGGVLFRIIPGEEPAEAFARGLREIVNRKRENGLSRIDLDYARYAVATAELVGVSKDQLRCANALEGLYPPQTTINKEGKETPNAEYVTTKDAREALHILGIPDVKPQHPQITTDMQAAEQTKRDLLDSLVKAGGVAGLPVEDIRQRADEIAAERMQPKSPKGKDRKRVEELRQIVKGRSPDELALIISNPDRLANTKNLKLASIVKRKVRFTKGWRKLSPEEKIQRRSDEQFAALVATPEQLKQLEDRYKSLEAWPLTFIKFLFGITLVTGYDLITGEVGGAIEGKTLS